LSGRLSTARLSPKCCRRGAVRATAANHRRGRPTRSARPRRQRRASAWGSPARALFEVGFVLAVLGVLDLQPVVKFTIVGLAAIAAVRVGIVAEVEHPSPAAGAVRRRAVRSEAAEQGDVARLQPERNGRDAGYSVIRHRVVVAVFGCETALPVKAWEDLGAAVLRAAGVDGHDRGDEAARKTGP